MSLGEQLHLNHGQAEVFTVWREGEDWRWSVWSHGGFREGRALSERLAWRAARDARDGLERTDAVARP